MKVLMVYDSPNWAFHSQANGLISNGKIGIDYDMCSMAEFLKADLDKYDVIFAMGLFGMSNGQYARRLLGRKFVTMVHHEPDNVGFERGGGENPWLPNEKKFVKLAARHSSISNAIRTGWIEKCNIFSEYLPSGIDTKLFKPSGILKNKEITIGWCGNPKKLLKGFPDIIMPAMKIIQKKYSNVKFKFRGYDKLIPHNEMPLFYKDIDLYICASSYEGLPTPLVEAAACGIPFVSTNVGVVSEININGNNCIVDRNIPSLVSGIAHMIENPEAMILAGKDNREVILAGWSWDVVSYIWEYFITGEMEKMHEKQIERKAMLKKKERIMPFIKKDMAKLDKFILGSDPWSEKLKTYLRQLPHYKTMQQLKDNPNIAVDQTEYYKWLLKGLEKRGYVWGGVIKDVKGIEKQCKKFFELIQNPSLGEQGDEVIFSKKNKDGNTYYYGHYPVSVEDDGSFRLMDGRHRAVIKLFNNQPIEITICDRSKKWKVLLENLEIIYAGKRLYQPVNHPDLIGWKSGRDNLIEGHLDGIFKELKIKSVIDLGICHGYTLYKLKDNIETAIGIEYNKTRHSIAKALFDQIGFEAVNINAVEFINKNKKSVDCVLALAILHHIIKQKSKKDFDETLAKISDMCKVFVYTLPEPTEPQFSWIPEEIRDSIHEYIEKKIGFANKRVCQLRSRKMIILYK